MLYLTSLLLLLLIINNADLGGWLERQCRPKIKLGRQTFRRPTAGRGWHIVSTRFIVDYGCECSCFEELCVASIYF